jgi:hypothetical protein
MPASLLNDPLHWRRRAEEARQIAAMLADATAREQILNCAKSYERIAELSEQRSIGAEKKSLAP